MGPDPTKDGAPLTPARRSLARRVLRIALRLLGPCLITAVAAVLGYAFAIYPMWRWVSFSKQFQNLGHLIAPEHALSVYFDDNHLDAKSLGGVAWSIDSVMTPFVGYAPAPGQHYNAHIEAHQFRGSRELTTPKPPGVFRIFLTGASVAFGMGAPSDERTIGGYLQSLLDARSRETGERYEVFTFAAGAWSSTHERIAIDNRLSDLEPDLVLELTGTADCLYGQRGLNVLWGRSLTDTFYWDLVNMTLRRSGFGPMSDVQDRSKKPVPAATVADRLRKNVVLSAAALSPVNARLRVFLQPSIFTTRKTLSEFEGKTRANHWGVTVDPEYYQQCSKQIGERLGNGELPGNVAFTDLTSVFDQFPQDPDVFLDSFHFGDRGNLPIAQAMVSTIVGRGQTLARSHP